MQTSTLIDRACTGSYSILPSHRRMHQRRLFKQTGASNRDTVFPGATAKDWLHWWPYIQTLVVFAYKSARARKEDVALR
jgi:hypothetical protein